ncbi:hypothetical protein TGARI_250500A [Toxoplasma gondii ARI]|uniref:Uncharacterized protein n=1 Tax=Toxoplasma gondii ARI TaxID=1074872 RepID=A0A139YBJ4_TOXGO|nr:hypothetical protein TGARI_250500A [Toxoplasma gondii ARI]
MPWPNGWTGSLYHEVTSAKVDVGGWHFRVHFTLSLPAMLLLTHRKQYPGSRPTMAGRGQRLRVMQACLYQRLVMQECLQRRRVMQEYLQRHRVMQEYLQRRRVMQEYLQRRRVVQTCLFQRRGVPRSARI